MWNTLLDKTRRFVDTTLLLSLAGAFFYWASFPPLSARVCAWFVPFIWTCISHRLVNQNKPFRKTDWHHRASARHCEEATDCREEGTTGATVFKIWLSGYICWLALLDWLCYEIWWMLVAWMTTAALLGLFWTGYIWVSATATVRYRLPRPLVMAVAWCGLEWCRRNLLLGGFPFAALEHSQYRNVLLIQIADIAGEYGLGFLMVIVGACVAEVTLGRPTLADSEEVSASGVGWRLAHAGVALGIVVSLFGYGAYRVSLARSEDVFDSPSRTIALLQSATELSGILRPPDVEHAFDESKTLSMGYGPHADLVVWPEAVCNLRWAYLQPGYIPSDWRGQPSDLVERVVEGARSAFSRPLVDLARASDAPLLLNLPVRDYRCGGSGGKLPPTNSVLYVDPVAGVTGRYDKMKLVPFLECDPGQCILGRDLFFQSQFRRGKQAVAFAVPKKETARARQSHVVLPSAASREQFIVTVNICFDSLFPGIVRGHVASLRRRGLEPDVIINVSNDADSKRKNALDMHLATHVFRAVENRKPYLVASNCGVAAWIDCCGRIVQQGEAGSAGCVMAHVARSHVGSVYARVGDILPLACVLAMVWMLFPLDRLSRHRLDSE